MASASVIKSSLNSGRKKIPKRDRNTRGKERFLVHCPSIVTLKLGSRMPIANLSRLQDFCNAYLSEIFQETL